MKQRSYARRWRWLPALLLSASALACGENDSDTSLGRGQLEVSVSGEDAAESGFPFTEDGETVGFVDDWQIRFDKFLISIGDLELRGADGRVAVSDSRRFVADLHAGEQTLAAFRELPARRWENFGFSIVPPDAGAVPVAGATEADVERMRSGGFNYWIQGSASKADQQLTFAWGISNPTLHTECTNGVDETQGIVVPNNSQASAEITIHLEHMFWTSLGSEGSELRFEAIAAAGRDDGEITWDDLAEQRLSNLLGFDGERLIDANGEPIVYNPESVRLEAQDLRSFILASSSSMAHLNGEGLCSVRRAP